MPNLLFYFILFLNRAFYVIMWKNTVERGRQYEINLHVFSCISFYLTVNIFRHHYKDQTAAQIIAVYFEIHTKSTSTRNGHIEEIQDMKIGVTRCEELTI